MYIVGYKNIYGTFVPLDKSGTLFFSSFLKSHCENYIKERIKSIAKTEGLVIENEPKKEEDGSTEYRFGFYSSLFKRDISESFIIMPMKPVPITVDKDV